MGFDFNKSFNEYARRKKAIEYKILILDTPINELLSYRELKDTIDDKCPICLGEFDDSERVEQCVVCYRYFHYQELRDWVKKAKTCPICKNEPEI